MLAAATPPPAPTAKGTSGWEVETLFVYFNSMLEQAEKHSNQRFVDQEKAVEAALAAAKQAVDKAEINSEKWRANANEWRAAMTDRERMFMPRSEAEKSSITNADKIVALEKMIERSTGQGMGLKAGWGYILGAIAALEGIFIIYANLHH